MNRTYTFTDYRNFKWSSASSNNASFTTQSLWHDLMLGNNSRVPFQSDPSHCISRPKYCQPTFQEVGEVAVLPLITFGSSSQSSVQYAMFLSTCDACRLYSTEFSDCPKDQFGKLKETPHQTLRLYKKCIQVGANLWKVLSSQLHTPKSLATPWIQKGEAGFYAPSVFQVDFSMGTFSCSHLLFQPKIESTSPSYHEKN